MSQLMAQRMNRMLRQSIEAAISRFECHEFGTGIMVSYFHVYK